MNALRKNGLAAMALVMTAALLSACADPDGTTGGAGGRSADYLPPANIGSGGIDRNSLDDGVVHVWPQSIADRVFFETDKSSVKPEGRELLAKWVAFLNSHPRDQLLIEGHSDERGTREYNLALGERRASAIKEFLVASGIQADRVKTVSYGKERPAVIGSNEPAYSQNRRAVGILQ
jgi:peptidoglycan-associated lipoprotein